MNTYQKVGTLLVRIVGGAVLFVGCAGPFGLVVGAVSGAASAYSSDRWAGSVFWMLAGLALILASGPLGRLAGRGLD